MKAAVIGTIEGKPILTNQAMHPFIPLESSQEAHYICACMNNSIFGLAVVAHTQEGGKSFAQSNILEHIRIPRYDPSNSVHRKLAKLSLAAHKAAKVGDEKHLKEIENEIDTLSAKLWGLTDDELREIQQSLHILAEELKTKEQEEEVDEE